MPSHWAGVYACWGLENREAALRMITGSAGSSDWAANLEVKCLDLTANPYLLLAGLLAAGFDGVAGGARLPEPVDVDPAALPSDELERRGIQRLPTSLRQSTDALAADQVLRDALGSGASGLGASGPRVRDRTVRRGLGRGGRPGFAVDALIPPPRMRRVPLPDASRAPLRHEPAMWHSTV